MKTILTLIAIGAAAGLLGALCGVGGGIIMVPAFTLALKMEQKQAVATSLAAVVFSALVSTLNNARTPNLIDWKLVAIVAATAVISSWYGSDLMKQLSNPMLNRIFAILMIVIGVRMLWK